jgi:hypothetical protein
VELLLNKEGLMSLLSVQGTQLILKVNGVNNVVQSLLNLVDGLNTTVVDNGDGSVQIDVTAGGTGTVTSVTVNASNALSASGNPITTSGTITLNWTGNNTQFVRGDGTLSAILTALSQFTNDVGFITSAALAPYLTSAIAAATYVPLTRTITIQGVTQDLSADRSWSFPSLPFKGGMYVEQTFTSTNGPVSVLWIPTVNKVYCCNQGANTITVFNATTGELTNTLLLTGPTSIKYVSNSPTPEIWAFNTSVNISRINITATPGGESIFATIVGTQAQAGNLINTVAEFSATKNFYSSSGGANINYANPTTGTFIGTTLMIPAAVSISLALNNNPLSVQFQRVVVGASTSLYVFNANTNALISSNQNPSSLISFAKSIRYVASRDIYIVASRDTRRIVILSPLTDSTFSLVTSIGGMFFPSDIFVDEVNNLFFVSHSVTNTLFLYITVFDLITYESLYTLPIPLAGQNLVNYSEISGDVSSRRLFVTINNNIANPTFVKIKY